MAKHSSSEKLLQKYNRPDAMSSDDDDDDELSSQGMGSNSIVELMNYCTVKDYHKPEFECILECGPSHAPSFTFQCRLDSIKRSATAGNKQEAKQMSAKKVLDIIKEVCHTLRNGLL